MIISLLLPLTCVAFLSPCQKSIVEQVTNIYENSKLDFQFDYCENINDGRGYTSGIVGFTTGTGDAIQVIRNYSGNEFNQYLTTLTTLSQSTSNSADVSGLEGYCQAWSGASFNSEFRRMQVNAMENLYYIPSQRVADAVGLELAVSRGQFYDTAVQMGTFNGSDTLEDLLSRLNISATQSTTKFQILYGNESNFMNSFMDLRKQVLCNPAMNTTQKAWCESVTRVTSYQHILALNPVFEDYALALDNDGLELRVNCDLDIETRYSKSRHGPDIFLICIVLVPTLILTGCALFYYYQKRVY